MASAGSMDRLARTAGSASCEVFRQHGELAPMVLDQGSQRLAAELRHVIEAFLLRSFQGKPSATRARESIADIERRITECDHRFAHELRQRVVQQLDAARAERWTVRTQPAVNAPVVFPGISELQQPEETFEGMPLLVQQQCRQQRS